MKVALVTYSTRPRGSVVHTLALAEALHRGGADVDVWTLGRHGDRSFYRDVDVPTHVIDCPDVPGETFGERVVRSVALLGRALPPAGTEGPYDLVHAQDCIAANAAGPNCLRTVHHLDAFTTPELVACHERAIRAPRALACVTESVAREVSAGYGRRAVVVGNGVDQRYLGAQPEPLWRKRFGWFVLSVGGLEPRKGSADLVEAMASLPSSTPLVVVGGDSVRDHRGYRDAVIARASQLGVRLEMLGPVAHETMPGLVAAAGVFAFPSVNEGFGLAPLEALAAGVPVVCRDLPVLREVFDGAAVFFHDLPQLAAALGARPSSARHIAGRALAARHSWDDVARRHLAWYHALLTPRRAYP